MLDEEPARLGALVHDLLVRRTAAAGAQPLLVHVDDAGGTRVELSGTSLTNSVAKASALLRAEGPGVSVALAIPPHWIGAALALAAWHVGGSVSVRQAGQSLGVATVGVVGPEIPGAAPEDVTTLYVSRLHPFGLPFDADVDLPWYAADLSPALREGPDVLGPPALPGEATSPAQRDIALREAALIAAARTYTALLPSGSTLLSTLPLHDLRGLLAVTLVPLLTGGSTVLVTGTSDPDRLADIAAAERASTTWATSRPARTSL